MGLEVQNNNENTECKVKSSSVLDREIGNALSKNIKECRGKELYEEMNDAGGYDNLPDNKKLDYRIYVMWELPDLAESEIRLQQKWGYQKLSVSEKQIINKLRSDYLSESYFTTYKVKEWDTLWWIIKNKYDNISSQEIIWIINSLQRQNPYFKDTLSISKDWNTIQIPDGIPWDNIKTWDIIAF